jgi:molybdate transport system regulatory protein
MVMPKSSPKSLSSLSVRIYLDAEGHIGHGKIELLENIHSCDSISGAGRAMNMSYRRA